MGEELSTKFWEDYAALYAYFTPSFQRELLAYVGNQAFGKVADLGVGVGKLIPYLQANPKVSSILGVDASQEMLRAASRYKVDSKKPIDLYNANLNEIQKLGLSGMDTLVFLNVLYANSDPISLLKDTRQYLTQGGKIIISDMKREVQFDRLAVQLMKEYKDDEELLNKYFEMNRFLTQGMVPRAYTLEEMCSLLDVVGFDVRESVDSHFMGSSYTVVGIKR